MKTKQLQRIMMLVVSILILTIMQAFAADTKELGSYTFTNGATMPEGVTNSNGVVFATSRFAFKSSSAFITIDNLSIPDNATTLYVVVKCVENGSNDETITVSGLNSSGTSVASATFTPPQKSNLSNATVIDNAVSDKEVSFSATGVKKIKIQATTFGSNFIIHTVTVSCDTQTGGSS